MSQYAMADNEQLSPLAQSRPLVTAATYRDKMLGYTPFFYAMLAETVGIVAAEEVNPAQQNGAYSSDVSGWPPDTGIGDGNTAPTFDGATTFALFNSAAFGASFDGSEGSLALWCKADPATWTDGTWRHALFTQADSNNRLRLSQTNLANKFRWLYEAGNQTDFQDKTMSPSEWFFCPMTWSKSADQVKYYYYTGGVGGLFFTDAGLGNWAGAPTVVQLSYQALWKGQIAHCAFFDKVLTLSDWDDLAIVV